MATRIFDVSGQIVLHFDALSKEFANALESYNETMCPGSSATDMLRHVAFSITRFGIEQMVEGVGYVGKQHKGKDNYSGITVDEGYDEFEFD